MSGVDGGRWEGKWREVELGLVCKTNKKIKKEPTKNNPQFYRLQVSQLCKAAYL